MSCPLVAIIAINNFSPFHCSIPSFIFEQNYDGQPLFKLKICAAETGELASRQGLSIQTDHDLALLAHADIIIIPYWRDPAEKPNQALLEALKSAHQRGACLVGLCLGSYVLAYADLLNHHQATTHWQFANDFQQRFPEVKLDTNALYIHDQQIVTSAGAAAGMDCCLYLVRHYYGGTIANHIAKRMVLAPHREGGQAQFIEHPVPVSTQDKRINQLLNYLRANIDQSHNLDQLAERSAMSKRTLTRQFLRLTGMTIGEWLLKERLKISQILLESTTLPVERIAEQVGFSSATVLRDHFKQQFKLAPNQWRKNFAFNSQNQCKQHNAKD